MTERLKADYMERPFADTFEDFLAEPNKFGFCTPEEFMRNPERWRRHDETTYSVVDKGGQDSNKFTLKIFYEICGYRTEILEEVQRIAKNEGISDEDLDFKAMVLPEVAGKGNILVKFFKKRKESLNEYNSEALP